ncbi:MAG TPA: DUF465 domain-containing protein [Thermohalobaculum sp.]|nr:DUF465 domain-containing protein [Thermohalobaculum sp.]
MDPKETLRAELEELRRRHRALDGELEGLGEVARADPLTMQRIKKQKLQLKDRIARLEDQLYPDIIA